MPDYNYRYKVSLQQQMTLLFPVLITNIFLFIGFPYLLNISLNNTAFIITFIVFFIIDILPTILLHTKYWIKNHDALLVLNTDTKELTYESSKQQLKYCFNDITSLKYYRSYAKGTGWHSFGQYRYYKVTFNDNMELIITCLMINDIENTFESLLRIEAEKYFKLVCLL